MVGITVISFNYAGRIPKEYMISDINRISRHCSKYSIPLTIFSDEDYINETHFVDYLAKTAEKRNHLLYFLGHAVPDGFVVPKNDTVPWKDIANAIDYADIFVIVDCCYAARLFESARYLFGIASCKRNETSIFVNSTRGSLFTYALFSGKLSSVRLTAANNGIKQSPVIFTSSSGRKLHPAYGLLVY